MLEVAQKVVDFYHMEGIDLLKLECTLPNLANNCLQKSTTALFYPFTESGRIAFVGEKFEDTVVFTTNLVWTRLLFVNQQTSAKFLLKIMLVTFIFTLRAKRRLSICTQNGDSALNLESLNRVKAE